MYLFIFESIGTQELIMIGLAALIIFGPRKLPELARMFGKTMADFRKVTNEFKSTWEKEVAEDKKMLKSFSTDSLDNPSSISSYSAPKENQDPLKPQIKELSSADIESIFQKKDVNEENILPDKTSQEEPPAASALKKHDWL